MIDAVPLLTGLASELGSPWLALALFAAGLVAGFVNTMAGGGSLLTLPALMLLGLPADVANGTNRVGVLAQSASGMLGFHRAGKLDLRSAPIAAVPASIGATLGALAAANVPREVLKPALIASMLAMAIAMVAKPDAITAPEGAEPRLMKESPRALAVLFVAGLYGGFVQAGVGFILLAALGGILRYDIVRANALKLFCTTIFGLLPLIVFVNAGQVRWVPGAMVAAGTVGGSQLGVRFALRAKHRTMHYIVLGCAIVTCIAALFKGG